MKISGKTLSYAKEYKIIEMWKASFLLKTGRLGKLFQRYETVDEIVLPAAVETAGMAETIDGAATFGKSAQETGEYALAALQRF